MNLDMNVLQDENCMDHNKRVPERFQRPQHDLINCDRESAKYLLKGCSLVILCKRSLQSMCVCLVIRERIENIIRAS